MHFIKYFNLGTTIVHIKIKELYELWAVSKSCGGSFMARGDI